MQSKTIDIFKSLVKVPNCSFKTKEMQDYIRNRIEKYADVKIDKAGNILAKVGNPKLCLQAHYDMVCVNTNGAVNLIIEGNLMKGNNSSLGADNGLGVALMISLIEEKQDGYYLFTNDEEVGMVGANSLDLDIDTKYFLNLDEEREGIITIGCAGGFDAIFEGRFEQEKNANCDFYRISLSNYPGGHSGISIHENIPHPLKELLYYAKDHAKYVTKIEAGEKRNSIPSNALIELGVEKGKILESKKIKIEKIPTPKAVYSKKIIDILGSFPHGVLAWLNEFNLPMESVNFALVSFSEGKLKIALTYRAMNDKSLENLQKDAKFLANLADLELKIEYFYNSWSEEKSDFHAKLQKLYKGAKLKSIHAGLECAVLKNKFPNASFAAIGPNIFNPHSVAEVAEIQSTLNFEKLVRKIMKEFNNKIL